MINLTVHDSHVNTTKTVDLYTAFVVYLNTRPPT